MVTIKKWPEVTKSGWGGILAHVERGEVSDGNLKKLRKYKNQNIVFTILSTNRAII